jgi:hypothetical protein
MLEENANDHCIKGRGTSYKYYSLFGLQAPAVNKKRKFHDSIEAAQRGNVSVL